MHIQYLQLINTFITTVLFKDLYGNISAFSKVKKPIIITIIKPWKSNAEKEKKNLWMVGFPEISR